ncbi:amino acid transporter [Dichomitus squalens LYAD-421 SS1]|uniref:Amino acid transporter n=1 Tax=Dichomitus squalens (strain LYAD-421) TaxID=732165 RepID=R7SHW7_DICSQ|nr:amino acid transporter [Dichomitus squalens LYAD-421 SS1]EJF55719.1 amino acid transporter [Dichomitus squalens LYAD-421 SS1]
MISIGGVIGTGLFVGSADAIRNGGPVGAILGYSIVGTVVYCLCVSVGEMIAFLPNVGGVVGLADLYVDPALGFSLGWAAWYNWSVTLPTEITAAAVVIGYWKDDIAKSRYERLVIATTINCFPSRVYGQMEYTLSCLKVLTIVCVIILGLLIDLGASKQGVIGFRNWKEQPFTDKYLGIGGPKGQFLGFWAVIMQASFSFFGSEVPGIAAGEVVDATRNVPRALRKVWIRITLFYVGGVLVSGLLVPASDPNLGLGDEGDKTGRSSPFVIAFSRAGWTVLPDMINAAILLSAWSAAASDIYISSRFLFFLARRGHAPTFLAHLFRYPRARAVPQSDRGSDDDSDDSEQVLPSSQPTYVMPLASVLVSASVGLLTFLSYGAGSANTVFNWLVNVASVASLQSWAGMLFTYIRWHQGTVFHEKKWEKDESEEGREAMAQIAKIKENRNWGQPYLAWYALILCMVVLFTNGWAVFVHNNWRIANALGQKSPDSNAVSQFLSAYIPLPFFLLLTYGYKLIKQTEMIPLEKMSFYRGDLPPHNPADDEPQGPLERLLAWLLLI